MVPSRNYVEFWNAPQVEVLASDRGSQLRAVVAPSRAKVRVHVLRVNQHDPQIVVRHLPQVMEQSQVRSHLRLPCFTEFSWL